MGSPEGPEHLSEPSSSSAAVPWPTRSDHEADCRSTTCSSHSEAPGEQAEAVVNAMVPIVRRAMVSSNNAVFQASLDSMRQIQHMFGREAIDQHIGTLIGALETHSAKANGSSRAARVFETLTALCSEDVAAALQIQFPQYCVGAQPPSGGLRL